MKPSRIALLCTVIALASAAAGFWFGAREGEYVAAVASAPLRGGFAVTALINLKVGKIERASLMYEFEVNQGLIALNKISESRSLRFVSHVLAFDPLSSTVSSVVEDYATKMADYRKANVSPFKGEFLTHFDGETPEQRAMIDEALERHSENAQIIRQMVERYASK